MTKGTAPVPPIAPALIAMMTYCLFRGDRIRGSHSGGVKPLLSV